MYELIDEAESHRYRNECSHVLTEACTLLKEKGIIAQFTLVGSGARNLITRNGNGPYDLDYNLEIISADDAYSKDLRRLKDTVRVALNKANGFDFSDAHDSTSVLTCLLHFYDYPNLEFSFDVAIVAKNSDGTMRRLVHNKNAWGGGQDQYTWNNVPCSHNVAKKAAAIKKANLWLDVRERYVELKNQYLERGDTDHPSFIVYVEAVNEAYNRLPKSVPVKKKAKPTTPEKKPTAHAKVAKGPTKTEFNCAVQQAISKAKRYNNDIICPAASLACENFDGKKSKKALQNELRQKFGVNVGNDIYTRIAHLLK